MQILRLPRWGFDYQTAEYYGYAHALHIGIWLILWGSA